MKYKIYELVKPSALRTTEPDGYHMKTTELITLKDINSWELKLEDEHNSHESAKAAIINSGVKDIDLVILPVVSVSWNGDIKE